MATLTALTVAALAPTTGARATAHRSFRLIVMDMRQDLGDTTSYAAYRAHLAERIQTASAAFATDKPNLVALPEDAGLMAWLVGPRAAAARAMPRSDAALASLAVPYAPQVAYYQAKCPGIPPARALFLALTDTAWRAFTEALAALAAQHAVWIMASLNAPDVTVVRDPEKVALLADPAEAAKGYAYEGGCDIYNTALLYPPSASLDPDGAADPARVLGGSQRKAYLVPIERAQDVGLAMTGERVANVRPIVTPFARLGVLTSKDAWMPDVAERLDDAGMEVMIQPEAGDWAGRSPAGLPNWPPDAMQRAIWAQVQRLPGTRYGGLPNLTGNFFDLYFDGTATITKDAEPADADGFLLGRLPQDGFLARAPWVAPDPPPGTPITDLLARRAFLDGAGRKLEPGSGDPLENRQLEGLVWTDVELPPRHTSPRMAPPATLPAALRLSPTGHAQWAPSLAPDGAGGVQIAWTDTLLGNERPAVARAVGASIAAPRYQGGGPRPADQQANRYDVRVIALAGGAVQGVWTDFRNQSWSIYGTHTLGPDGEWEEELLVDHSPTSLDDSAEGFPNENINHDPAIARAPDGTLYAAWADVRGRRVPWRIGVARSADDGHSWEGDVRADGGGALESTREQLDELHPTLAGDQFAPAIAVAPNGGVWVAWQDHATPRPRILVNRSTDGGATFGTPVIVDPWGIGAQYRPVLAFAPDGALAVAWEDAREGSRRIRMAIEPAGGPFGPSLDVDSGAPAGTTQARPALAPLPGGGFGAAWQDDRGGDWDVLLAVVSAAGMPAAPSRVDDGPDGSDARHPAITATASGVALAWEDTRTGPEQIFYQPVLTQEPGPAA